MAKKLKKLISDYSYIGPKRVMRGDLTDIGLSGTLFAPTGRAAVPTVVLLNDWLVSASLYNEMGRHLASWGIACVVPNFGLGLLADAEDLAQRVEHVLDAVFHTSIGNGTAPLDRSKVALVGHGMGASVAALVAARRPELSAVVAAYPTEAVPDPRTVVGKAKAPVLILKPEDESSILSVDIAKDLANKWGGKVVMRRVEGTSRQGLFGDSLLALFESSKMDKVKALRTQTALMTGYLIAQLLDNKDCEPFTDVEADIPGTFAVLTTRQRLEQEDKKEKKKFLFF